MKKLKEYTLCEMAVKYKISGNYIEGYKLAPGKKVNTPPPHDIKTYISSPCGGGCYNPRF